MDKAICIWFHVKKNMAYIHFYIYVYIYIAFEVTAVNALYLQQHAYMR